MRAAPTPATAPATYFFAGKTSPTSGYTRFGVTATAGTCYAALSLSNSCEVILFRVSGLSGSVAALDWRTVAEP